LAGGPLRALTKFIVGCFRPLFLYNEVPDRGGKIMRKIDFLVNLLALMNLLSKKNSLKKNSRFLV
jgi:hypothetical protein